MEPLSTAGFRWCNIASVYAYACMLHMACSTRYSANMEIIHKHTKATNLSHTLTRIVASGDWVSVGVTHFARHQNALSAIKKNREKKTNKQTTPLALVWEYIVYTINPLGWLLSAMHKYTSQLLIWSSYYLSPIIRVERAIQKLLSHRAEAEAVSGMDICCVVLRSVLCKWKKVPDGRLMNKLYWAWYVGKCWRMRVMKSRRHTYTNRRTKYKKIEAMNFAFNTRLIIIIRFVNVHVHYV